MNIKIENERDYSKINWELEFETFCRVEGLRSGNNIPCPYASEHTNKSTGKEFCFGLSNKTNINGCRFPYMSCFHDSCSDSIILYRKKVASKWSKFIGKNSEPISEEVMQQRVIDECKRLLKLDEEKKRVEKMINEDTERVFGKLNKMTDVVPPPCFESHMVDVVKHVSLFNIKTDVIFVGDRYDSENGTILLTCDNLNDRLKAGAEFITTSVFVTAGQPRTTDNRLKSPYVVLEMDGELDKDIQWRRLLCVSKHISPMLLCVDSGGKSLHGWFKRTDIEPYVPMLVEVGYDGATIRPLQIVRLAGCYRKDKGNYQRLLYFNKDEVTRVKSEYNKS